MIRDVLQAVLLGVFAAGWLFAVILTAWRTGAVPAELWAVLGIGVGALLAAFRVEGGDRRRVGPSDNEPPEGQ